MSEVIIMNKRIVSPIIAVILMIAVGLAISFVVYLWVEDIQEMNKISLNDTEKKNIARFTLGSSKEFVKMRDEQDWVWTENKGIIATNPENIDLYSSSRLFLRKVREGNHKLCYGYDVIYREYKAEEIYICTVWILTDNVLVDDGVYGCQILGFYTREELEEIKNTGWKMPPRAYPTIMEEKEIIKKHIRVLKALEERETKVGENRKVYLYLEILPPSENISAYPTFCLYIDEVPIYQRIPSNLYVEGE